MSPYPNSTIYQVGVVTKVTDTIIIPNPTAAATAITTEIANSVNTCNCEGLKTAVILFSGLDAGVLAVTLVLLFWRRSKWIKKGAAAAKAGKEERKGLLAR